MEFNINYLALLVAMVAAQVLGFLWYGPLFGKVWSGEMGWGIMTPEQLKEKQKGATPGYIFNFIFAFITAYVLTHVLQAFGSNSYGMAAQGAVWCWLGFMLPIHAGKKLWMGKTWKLVFIDSGYSLASLLVSALILQAWM